MWLKIVNTLKTGFDVSGGNIMHDWSFALYMAIQAKTIKINANGISFLLRDVSKLLIAALKTNDKTVFNFYNIILSISKSTNPQSILKSCEFDVRFVTLIKLYEVVLYATQIRNHWIHDSLTTIGFIHNINLAIENLHQQSICLGKEIRTTELYLRMIKLNKLKNKLNIKYLHKIMQIERNERIIKYSMEIQSCSLNKCFNDKCTKNYFKHKYGKSRNEITRLTARGQEIVCINKWYRCKQCKIALYCRRKCQKYHWKYEHHKYCKKYNC